MYPSDPERTHTEPNEPGHGTTYGSGYSPDAEREIMDQAWSTEPVQYGPGGQRIELEWVAAVPVETSRKALRKSPFLSFPLPTPRTRLLPAGLVLASVVALFVALVIGFFTLNG